MQMLQKDYASRMGTPFQKMHMVSMFKEKQKKLSIVNVKFQ